MLHFGQIYGMQKRAEIPTGPLFSSKLHHLNISWVDKEMVTSGLTEWFVVIRSYPILWSNYGLQK